MYCVLCTVYVYDIVLYHPFVVVLIGGEFPLGACR